MHKFEKYLLFFHVILFYLFIYLFIYLFFYHEL